MVNVILTFPSSSLIVLGDAPSVSYGPLAGALTLITVKETRNKSVTERARIRVVLFFWVIRVRATANLAYFGVGASEASTRGSLVLLVGGQNSYRESRVCRPMLLQEGDPEKPGL